MLKVSRKYMDSIHASIQQIKDAALDISMAKNEALAT